jgi:hypothetical protein
LAAGRPSITVGGKRLWRHRNHLDATDMTEQQWAERWMAARMFLTADGESGKPGGNETIRVDEAGRLRIKVPAELIPRRRAWRNRKSKSPIWRNVSKAPAGVGIPTSAAMAQYWKRTTSSPY